MKPGDGGAFRGVTGDGDAFRWEARRKDRVHKVVLTEIFV